MNDAETIALRHRLLNRIRRRYQVVTEQLQIGPLSFPFTRIADPDKVLDEVAAEADLRDRLSGSPAPGDELQVTVWGHYNFSRRFIVSRTGEVVLPDAGPISVAGAGFGGVGSIPRRKAQSSCPEGSGSATDALQGVPGVALFV